MDNNERAAATMTIPVLEFVPALTIAVATTTVSAAALYGPPVLFDIAMIAGVTAISYAWYCWWRHMYYAGAPIRFKLRARSGK